MNNVQTKYDSPLTLNKLYFEELSFRRKNKLVNGKLNLDIASEIKRKGEKITVTLKANVIHEKKCFDLSIVMIGEFSCDNALVEKYSNEIAEKNTVAIMFPYIRSQISLLTTQPDMNVVIIPPINVNDFIDNKSRDDNSD